MNLSRSNAELRGMAERGMEPHPIFTTRLPGEAEAPHVSQTPNGPGSERKAGPLPDLPTKPVLFDFFCGAGGCTKGYQRAGFFVVGIDLNSQPNYCGDVFVQMDALEALRVLLDGGEIAGYQIEDIAAFHASPPCQAHSSIAKQQRIRRPGAFDHPDLVDDTRELVKRSGLPYVIENVIGAPLDNPFMLCGSSFGLDVRRHRLFETNFPMLAPPCAHYWQTPRFISLDKRRGNKSVVPVHGGGQLAGVVGVHGHHNYAGERELREKAMGIDWMSPYELTQAIPPAYTEYIGDYLMAEVVGRKAA